MSFDEQRYGTTDTIQIFESIQSNVSLAIKAQRHNYSYACRMHWLLLISIYDLIL